MKKVYALARKTTTAHCQGGDIKEYVVRNHDSRGDKLPPVFPRRAAADAYRKEHKRYANWRIIELEVAVTDEKETTDRKADALEKMLYSLRLQTDMDRTGIKLNAEAWAGDTLVVSSRFVVDRKLLTDEKSYPLIVRETGGMVSEVVRECISRITGIDTDAEPNKETPN